MVPHSEQATRVAGSVAGAFHEPGSHKVMENRIQFNIPIGVDLPPGEDSNAWGVFAD